MKQKHILPHCCGCTACSCICPVQAIVMKPDKKGFMKPEIDEKKCVKCGLCEKVCAFDQDRVIRHKKPMTIAAIHKNKDARMTSRSGGVFISLASYILNKGGVVYGVGMDDSLDVHYMRVVEQAQCILLQGSKYVQSAVGDIFLAVEEDLKINKEVLFSGTACTLEGLLSYLKLRGVQTESLLTCDIVCHGVVSPKMYKDYLLWLEKKYKGKISHFNFRDKSYGWTTHFESFIVNGKKHRAKGYTELYYSGVAFRDSCFKCKYTTVNRISDITLADCWGAEKRLPDMFDDKGISLVLFNSEKGKEIFNLISDELTYKKVDIKDFMQPQLERPIMKNSAYDEFWEYYLKDGFTYVIRKWGKQNLVDNTKRWIRNIFLSK